MCTNLDLKVFDGQDKSELSMIEVAHAILSQHGETMAFVDLANEVQQYLGKSDEEIRERLSQFYTDLNVDGSFIPLVTIHGACVHGIHLNQLMKQLSMKKMKTNLSVKSARRLTPFLLTPVMMTM
jgi:DNA-directed RNA polymerase, delta subunit